MGTHIPVSVESLRCFPVAELREYAKKLGVERGRSKADTIANLIASGKARLWASLAS